MVIQEMILSKTGIKLLFSWKLTDDKYYCDVYLFELSIFLWTDSI